MQRLQWVKQQQDDLKTLKKKKKKKTLWPLFLDGVQLPQG